MAYKNLKLGVSPLTKIVYAGRVNKKETMWIDKVNVTEQFLSCCIAYFKENEKNTITVDVKPEYIIYIKKV